jgi:formylglycine-generating enzyme required for sulfatase activity
MQYMKMQHRSCCRIPEFWGMEIYKSGPDFPDHPVVGVSQSDAGDYAKWAAKRSPAE